MAAAPAPPRASARRPACPAPGHAPARPHPSGRAPPPPESAPFARRWEGLPRPAPPRPACPCAGPVAAWRHPRPPAWGILSAGRARRQRFQLSRLSPTAPFLDAAEGCARCLSVPSAPCVPGKGENRGARRGARGAGAGDKARGRVPAQRRLRGHGPSAASSELCPSPVFLALVANVRTASNQKRVFSLFWRALTLQLRTDSTKTAIPSKESQEKMLRSLKGLVYHPLKLDHGYALHTAAKDCLSYVASQDVQTVAERPRAVFCTSENDPANHTEHHEGRHYSIPLEEVKAVFPHGLPYRFQQQIKTFNEACLMVRKPALELFTYLKSSNFAHPAVRYVIYGEKGTGKTMTLCHVVHYCARQGWLVLHVPDAHLWVKNCRELMQSSYNKERLDQPLQASFWLKNFKTSNERFLKEIKTQKKYVWGKRESTEAGRPLGEVVEQGLARVRNASDAVGVVLKEIKQQCHLGSFRLLVAVDGVNALWGRTTLKKEDKSPVSPEELTLVYNLRKMMMNDWNGGAIVATLSQTGSLFRPSSAYLPQQLLGKEGFDALDPFVPVPVPNYSPQEFESCYRYYLERKWLQHEKAHTEDGKEELRFLSGSNPRQLERLAGPL